MADPNKIPRPPMPWKIFWTWAVIIGAVVAFQQIQSGGWPPRSYAEFASSVVIGGGVGGYLWAWLYWRSLGSKKYGKTK